MVYYHICVSLRKLSLITRNNKMCDKAEKGNRRSPNSLKNVVAREIIGEMLL